MASAREPDRADGTGSLDFLIAATEAKPVVKLLEKLGLDRDAVVRRANAGRGPRTEPGLTADAKRVVEAVSHRALGRRRDATSIDLFVALAGTPGPARDVLLELGLNEQRLAVLAE